MYALKPRQTVTEQELEAIILGKIASDPTINIAAQQQGANGALYGNLGIQRRGRMGNEPNWDFAWYTSDTLANAAVRRIVEELQEIYDLEAL